MKKVIYKLDENSYQLLSFEQLIFHVSFRRRNNDMGKMLLTYVAEPTVAIRPLIFSTLDIWRKLFEAIFTPSNKT